MPDGSTKITHHQVHPDGTRTPVEHEPPELALEPITFTDPLSHRGALDEVEDVRTGLAECCEAAGIDNPSWGFGLQHVAAQLEACIIGWQEELEETRAERDQLAARVAELEAQQASGYRSAFNGGPGRIEESWARMHPAAAAEHDRRRECDQAALFIGHRRVSPEEWAADLPVGEFVRLPRDNESEEKNDGR